MRSKPVTIVLAAVGALALGGIFWAGRVSAAGAPALGALTYAGTLEDAKGAPLTTTPDIDILLWSTATPGATPLCRTSSPATKLTGGRFSIALADPCTAAVQASSDVWVEVKVDGTSLGSSKLGAVPYALEANHATSADSATSAAGGLQTSLANLQELVTTVQTKAANTGLACALRQGAQSKSNGLDTGSIVGCAQGEILTGGNCSPYSGRGGPVGHNNGITMSCALSNPSADPSDFVVAQATCCKVAQLN